MNKNIEIAPSLQLPVAQQAPLQTEEHAECCVIVGHPDGEAWRLIATPHAVNLRVDKLCMCEETDVATSMDAFVKDHLVEKLIVHLER